jgi:hypothetical protein
MKLHRRVRTFVAFVLTINLTIQPILLQAHQILSQNSARRKNVLTQQADNNNNLLETIVKSDLNPEKHAKEIYECCKASKQHIEITPDRLAGLNLHSVLHAVVQYAYETNSLHELPQGLINCCEMLEKGCCTVHAEDLNEALPVAMEKMMDPAMSSIIARAPRVDAPGSMDGSIVGPLVCDFSEVLAILNSLLQCCQTQLNCCNTLIADFNGTFTALADIKNTLTECCDTIIDDLNGTFTVLANLSTITSIAVVDFSPVFTALADLNNTLTICCDTVINDLNGTFTVLANLNCTVTAGTCDLTGVYTALTDIKNTVTTCCNGTFTTLNTINNEINGTFTAIAAINIDANSTFTAIADLKNTVPTVAMAPSPR